MANAVSEDVQNRAETGGGDQWKKGVARNGWCEKEDRKMIQEQARAKSRKEMRKQRNCEMCLAELLSVKYVKEKLGEVQGAYSTFFGKDHRMKEEEMEEQFNKEVKQGWRYPADAAMITDENVSEDCKAKKLEEGRGR